MGKLTDKQLITVKKEKELAGAVRDLKLNPERVMKSRMKLKEGLELSEDFDKDIKRSKVSDLNPFD